MNMFKEAVTATALSIGLSGVANANEKNVNTGSIDPKSAGIVKQVEETKSQSNKIVLSQKYDDGILGDIRRINDEKEVKKAKKREAEIEAKQEKNEKIETAKQVAEIKNGENYSNNVDINDISYNKKESSSFNNVNVYGINASKGNNGLGFNVYTDNFQGVVESAGDTQKAGVVLSTKFNNTMNFKVGASHLNINNYNIGENSLDVNQTTAGLGLGFLDKNTYFELGALFNSTRVKGVNFDDPTVRYYAEWVQRIETNAGQLDLTFSGTSIKALGEEKTNFTANLDYYPTNNTEINIEYNSNDVYVKGDCRVETGINVTFDGDFGPYGKVECNPESNVSTSFTYQLNIPEKPIQAKPTFENEMFSGALVADSVGGNAFAKKVGELLEKAKPTPEPTPAVVEEPTPEINTAPTTNNINLGLILNTENIDLSSYISDIETIDSNLALTVLSQSSSDYTVSISGSTVSINVIPGRGGGGGNIDIQVTDEGGKTAILTISYGGFISS